jgi:hypothetical protein
MWYLNREVVLTKDNLIKKIEGVENSVCSVHWKKPSNIFSLNAITKFNWTVIHIAFNIQKPASVLHLFTDWASTGALETESRV